MIITTFEDIIEQIRLPEEILKGIKDRLCLSSNGVKFQFTDLQKKAFNSEGYWFCQNKNPFPAHIVVQGATSSGKTLVSEMSVIECLNAKPKKKAIILVPLKAMVRERRDHFLQDLPEERIYASSSDFQDHDIDIISGNYDVAIIVYEKFFAMLSQPSNQVLKECALLVVDELQMLSSEGRGPKLEVSIQKVMHHNAKIGTNNPYGTYTRIMCLTTCDCKVDYVEKWLTVKEKKPLSIRSDSRPVGLEEYVLSTDGTLRGRYIPGERDREDHVEQFRKEPESLEVQNYNRNNRPENAKRLVLIALLKKVYIENPTAKVLVFVSDKRRTQEIAELIARENLLPYKTLSKNVLDDVRKFDNDDSQGALKRLLPYGIAFHNASLSMALREFVEKAFETDIKEKNDLFSDIKLIVATETLTIGMNMPVDIMILYDMAVPRGKEFRTKLTSQEYKNFVGRAGRLGLSNQVGKSYILALDKSDANAYWESYVNCKMEDIKSALMEAQEIVQAPYYLSLLTEGVQYYIKDINELRDASFSRCCDGKEIDMEKVMNELKKASLCTRREMEKEYEGDEDLVEKADSVQYEYSLTDLGKIFAPYALSLNTSKMVRRYFLNGGFRRYIETREFEKELQKKNGGIPLNIIAKDIETDRYLLDILYLLCKTDEVKNLGQLRLPSDDKLRVAKNIIWKKLNEMINSSQDDKCAKCELWKESNLRYILDGDCSDKETEEYQAVMRAILLWYWTKGKRISEIKKETDFNKFTPIYTGEVARLAEAVSYELDAIYRCTSVLTKSIYVNYGEDDRSPKAIYALSTRVNYGMPRNLVIIANRHLYGLDRLTVLKIGEAAKKYGFESPVRFLEQASPKELEDIITEQQRNELLSMINKLYLRDNLEGLLSTLQNNPRNIPISDVEANALRQLYDLRERDEKGDDNNAIEMLKDIFWDLDNEDYNTHKYFEDSVVIISKGNLNRVFELNFGQSLSIVATDYVGTSVASQIDKYFSKSQPASINLLFVRERNILKNMVYDGKTGRWCLLNKDQEEQVHNIDLAMTFQVFVILVAQTIALEDRQCFLLSKFIMDTKGAFEPKGTKSLYYLLKNYDSEFSSLENSTNAIRILCDYRIGFEQEACQKLLLELMNRKIPFRVLSWGNSLENEMALDAPTVLYITKESFQGQSIIHFFEKLRQHGFKKTCAVFDDEEQFKYLSTCPEFPFKGLSHLSDQSIAEKAKYISAWYKQEYLHKDGIQKYIIGVSYSHTRENGEQRPAVTALKKIIQRVNDTFGEENIVFDENESFKSKFDRNGAIEASLDLYQKCQYFIILDDNHYDDGDNCPREANIIKHCMTNSPEEYKQHVWFLRPMNDSGSVLFNSQKDFSRMMDYTEENVQDIANEIIRVILSEN